MKFKLCSLSCCFLGLLVSVTGHTQTSAPQVKFAGSLKAANAAPGRVVRAVFETTLPRGFHVNSNAPSDEFLKPTKLLLDTPAGVKIGRIDYPEPRPFKAEFSQEPLAVYEEHFVIGARTDHLCHQEVSLAGSGKASVAGRGARLGSCTPRPDAGRSGAMMGLLRF